jgi:hypothetical protein
MQIFHLVTLNLSTLSSIRGLFCSYPGTSTFEEEQQEILSHRAEGQLEGFFDNLLIH